jgi:thiamine biosynthesis lipoprotein
MRGRRWRIGIAHPQVADALTAVVAIEDGAVATSGTAERGPHVIDPHTGQPALELASVTVVGKDLGVADAYATAALAMGLGAPSWLDRLGGYESYVVDAGGNAWWSRGFERYLDVP